MLQRDLKMFAAGLIFGCFGLVTAFAAGAFSVQPADTAIMIDGETVTLQDAPLFITNSDWDAKKMYIPLREVLERLGYAVDYNGTEGWVQIRTASEMDAIQMPEPSAKVFNGLNVRIDPMVELLSVIQSIGDYDTNYGLMTTLEIGYKDEVADAFGPFRDHAAVQLFDELSLSGFSFDRPPGTMMLLNSDFTIDREAYANPKNSRVAIEELETFAAALQDFYLESDFEAFYEAHRPYYDAILSLIEQTLPQEPLIAALEDFFGMQLGSYTVVPVSLFHMGGFGASIARGDSERVYSIVGPLSVTDGVPAFGTTSGFEYMQLHEFGHSFIELGTDALASYMEQTAYLFEPIADVMTEQAYPTWDYALEEIILRATTVKIQHDDYSEAALEALQYELERGFAYVDTVYDSLMKYEADRDTYPDFDAFLPVIMADLLEGHPA